MVALKMAMAVRNVKDLFHYSDQRINYTSQAYTDLLKAHGISISVSVEGNPHENAHVEFFFKTLNQKEVYL